MKIEKSEIISFFRNIIGIKDKYALEQLGIHSRKWTLKARGILIKENEKVLTSSKVEDRYRYFLEIYPDLVEKVSKKDIASYLNMTPESLSRLLKNLEKKDTTKSAE